MAGLMSTDIIYRDENKSLKKKCEEHKSNLAVRDRRDCVCVIYVVHHT